MKLIDKDALVAEIEKCIYRCNEKKRSCPVNTQVEAICDNKINAYNEIISLLNTLEIKEVDFETAFAASIDHFDEKNNYGQWPETDLREFAEHFFELGLKASNVLTWEDMKQIRDIMVECSAIGLWSKPDEEYYQEVVKRFKAQKGLTV